MEEVRNHLGGDEWRVRNNLIRSWEVRNEFGNLIRVFIESARSNMWWPDPYGGHIRTVHPTPGPYIGRILDFSEACLTHMVRLTGRTIYMWPVCGFTSQVPWISPFHLRWIYEPYSAFAARKWPFVPWHGKSEWLCFWDFHIWYNMRSVVASHLNTWSMKFLPFPGLNIQYNIWIIGHLCGLYVGFVSRSLKHNIPISTYGCTCASHASSAARILGPDSPTLFLSILFQLQL